jgi:hypothetical protein
MKIRALIAAALLACGAALAQTDKAPANPAAEATAKPEATKPKPMARKHNPKRPKNNPKRSQDARHCLDKSSNTDIIKCAEAYL